MLKILHKIFKNPFYAKKTTTNVNNILIEKKCIKIYTEVYYGKIQEKFTFAISKYFCT